MMQFHVGQVLKFQNGDWAIEQIWRRDSQSLATIRRVDEDFDDYNIVTLENLAELTLSIYPPDDAAV